MSERGRALRRKYVNKAKHYARKISRIWGVPEYLENPTAIGKLAATHCRPCSCEMCGNQRHLYGFVTHKELIAAVSAKEQISEPDLPSNPTK